MTSRETARASLDEVRQIAQRLQDPGAQLSPAHRSHRPVERGQQELVDRAEVVEDQRLVEAAVLLAFGVQRHWNNLGGPV